MWPEGTIYEEEAEWRDRPRSVRSLQNKIQSFEDFKGMVINHVEHFFKILFDKESIERGECHY